MWTSRGIWLSRLRWSNVDGTQSGAAHKAAETGPVTSTGHVAPVRFAFPLDALQFLLPEPYPEAATRED